MAVEHRFDPAFGRAKPHLEIAFDSGLNNFEINGDPGRFGKEFKGRILQTHSDAFILLNVLVANQGEWITAERQIDLFTQSLPEGESLTRTQLRNRTRVARTLLVYRLSHEGKAIVHHQMGHQSYEQVGIFDYKIKVKKGA